MRLIVGARPDFAWSVPLLLFFAAVPANAQDATWLASPPNGNFSNDANWSTGVTPTGTASFDASTQTAISFNTSVSLDALQFNAGASAYTFTLGGFRTVEFNGAGIVNNSSNAPTINANLAFLNFNNSANAGNAIINNNGAVTFLNTSSAGFSTITTESGFTLSFSDNATAGNATIVVNDNGLAQFVTNGDGGNAQLIVNGIGGVIDFGFTLGRDNDNKTHAGSIAGDGGIILGDGQEFLVGSNNLSTTFSGTITECGCGLASLTKIGTGTLTLSGTNSYSGGTTFEGGTLSVSSEGNLGALAGGLTFNGGTLQITGTAFTSTARTITWGANGGGLDIADAANAFTVSQALTGTGGLTKLGAGTLALSAANTYSGATAVDAGMLRAGAADVFSGNSATTVASGATLSLNNFNQTIGSLAGAGSVSLGSATLTVGGLNTSTEFSGGISGSGGLVKAGTGLLLLSGVNSYTGATVVNGGTLSVTGSLATSGLTINSGGTLGGSGTIPTTAINGGTLSPGNSIGTISVAGNLGFTSASTYAVEVSGTSADRTNVTGTATLAGTVSVTASGTSFANRYTILSAAGRTGTFDTLVASGLPSYFLASLLYEGGDVFLGLTGQLGADGSLNDNQRSVANAIDGYFNGGGQLPASFASLYSLSGPALGASLTQLSGETATGAPTAMNHSAIQFLSLLGGGPSDVGHNNSSGLFGYAEQKPLSERTRLAYAAVTPRDRKSPWPGGRVWAAPYGGAARINGDAGTGSSDLDTRTYGIAAGVDFGAGSDTVWGFAAAGGGEKWNVTGGSGRGDVAQVGAYARHRFGSGYLDAAAAYAWHNFHTDRTLTVSGSDRLEADFSAHSVSARVETGIRQVVAGTGVTPYAAVTAFKAWLPSYAESATSGSSTFALTYAAQDDNAVRTELGGRFDRHLAVGSDSSLVLKARAAWAYDTSGNSSVTATFQSLPGASFAVAGADAPRHMALLSLGADWYLDRGFTVGLTADSELSPHSRSIAGRATLRYAW